MTGLSKNFTADKVTVDGKKIILSADALAQTNINLTTSDNFALVLGDDCPKVTTVAKGWKLDGTTATYHEAGKTDGYKLTNAKTVTYAASTGGADVVKEFTSEDKIKITDNSDVTASVKSRDIIVKAGTATMTLKNAATGTQINIVDATATTRTITLTGGENDDSLTGGKGNNLIDGNAGDDILIGNGGMDTFVYSSGDDTISDYESKDRISLASAMKNYDLDGDNVIIHFDDGSLTIQDAANSPVTFVETTNGRVTTNVNMFSRRTEFSTRRKPQSR